MMDDGGQAVSLLRTSYVGHFLEREVREEVSRGQWGPDPVAASRRVMGYGLWPMGSQCCAAMDAPSC